MSAPASPPTDPDARDDLVARLLEHCAMLCVTGDEDPIATAMVERYTALGEPVQRIGNSVVVGSPAAPDERPDADAFTDTAERGRQRPLVVLVGHLDVVEPTDEDLEAHVTTHDGLEVVRARGASDMKSGNVAAMAAFEDPELREHSPYDLVLVLYSGEEGSAESNELRDVLAAVPELGEAKLAIVLEPTDGEVQLGCLGSLHALVTFTGQQAHSARPWHGENALTKAGGLLAELHDDHIREVEVDGIAYRDVWSATQAWSAGFGPGQGGSKFRNVIPGTFTINLNLRFAPSRDLETAEAELRARIGEGAAVEIVDRSPAAPPRLDQPTVRAFVDAVSAPVAAKQAWTDVARFAEIDVPALNYGPGLTAQAHQRGEYVPVDALLDSHARLARFLSGTTTA